jgi:hypothetical protein
MCLEEAGLDQSAVGCGIVGLCECGDEQSGYEAGRRFVGYLVYIYIYILLFSSATVFCEKYE